MLEDEVQAMLAEGQLLNAVKHARKVLRSSLKEAKGFVDCIALHGFAPPAGMTSKTVNARILELRALLRAGARDEAVDGYRALSGATPEQAGDVMDVWHEEHQRDAQGADDHPDDRPWG